MELTGIRESPDNSRYSNFSEEGRPRHLVLVRNQDGKEKDSKLPLEIRNAQHGSQRL
jgi:hypothetical protein